MSDLSAFPDHQALARRNIPTGCSSIRCRRRTASRSRSCWKRSGLPYEAHLVDISKNDQKTPEFLSLNPNGKIPAIIDPDGPGGKPLGLFESGAILQYLAEKTGKLLPADPARRYETIQWVHFQMAAIGPMFGQLGFFHKFAGKEICRQAAAGALCRGVETAARRARDPARRPAMDHG